MVIRDTSDSALDQFTAGEAGFTGKLVIFHKANGRTARRTRFLPISILSNLVRSPVPERFSEE